MAPGEPIKVEQTELAPDYQNLIQPLNDPTAAGLASLTRELSQGVQGRGQNVQEILKQLQPAFGDADKLLASINRQNGILGQIVDQVQPLVNGLAADQGRTLDGTVNSANSLLNTTTVNEQQLRATIAELPSTLAAAQRTLGTVTGTAGDAEETLRELRPVTDNLSAISRELRGFTDAANPALRALNPLLDAANRLLDEARPLAEELKYTGKPLYEAVHALRPVSTSLTGNIGGPYGQGPDPRCFNQDIDAAALKQACLNPRVQGILGFLHNFALFTNQADTVGHYGALFTVVDAENILSKDGKNNTYMPCQFRGPGAKPFFCVNGQPRPTMPNGFPDGTQSQDDYPKGFTDGDKDGKDYGGDKKKSADKVKADADMAALTKAAPGLNKTILRGDPQAGGSATGLTPTQEQNALGTLMGGR
jgi:phospholipid/cholesterol/gamma-HCH transport system substrate-binding protein